MAPSIFRLPLVRMVLSSELQQSENTCPRISFFCVKNMVEATFLYTMLTFSQLLFPLLNITERVK